MGKPWTPVSTKPSWYLDEPRETDGLEAKDPKSRAEWGRHKEWLDGSGEDLGGRLAVPISFAETVQSDFTTDVEARKKRKTVCVQCKAMFK